MNSTIQRNAGRVAILLAGILLTASASARQVLVNCNISETSFTCTPDNDNSFKSFSADMEQPIGSGTDHAATINFKDGVTYYKGYVCDIDLEVDPGDISGDIVCNGHTATLKMSINTEIAGPDHGTGTFQ